MYSTFCVPLQVSSHPSLSDNISSNFIILTSTLSPYRFTKVLIVLGGDTNDSSTRRTGLVILFIGRTLGGLFGGTTPVVSAMVLDIVTDGRERPKFLGLIGASIGMGFILGPLCALIVLLIVSVSDASCLVSPATLDSARRCELVGYTSGKNHPVLLSLSLSLFALN